MRPTRSVGFSACSAAAYGAFALAAAWALGACSASDCRVGYSSNPLVTFQGGDRYAADGTPIVEGVEAEPFYYETSAPDAQHLPFGGGARYCIRHDLGRRPFLIEPWVSFKPTGTNGGNEAKPAGNMLEILHVNQCAIIVRNDSCGEYSLRLTASDPVGPSEPCDGSTFDPCLDPDDPED